MEYQKDTMIGRSELEMQAGLERLGLKGAKIITIDINGTIIPDDLKTKYSLDPTLVAAFHQERARLEADGWIVGLNSDSPYEVMAQFAAELGLPDNCPLIAEGGNVVGRANELLIFRELENPDAIVESVRRVSEEQCYQMVSEQAISPEFGGTYPDTSKKEWARGYGRLTSLSVFAPAEMIQMLEERKADILPVGVSADFSPEYEFLGFHPGEFKANKGQTMAALLDIGLGQARHIGNSNSDCCEDARVEVGLVGGADRKVRQENLQRAKFLSDADVSHLEAVVQIMRQM